MSFSSIYSRGKPVISLEFFPPKKEEDLGKTYDTICRQAELSPDFMTVTYGAGGGTRALTREIVGFIKRELDIPAVAHLTCVGHSKSEIDSVVSELYDEGIRHILALRGDPPKGQDTFTKHPEGFANAMELCGHLAAKDQFSLAVAGYPEGHQEAKSLDADLEFLKRKVDAGAEIVITQLFFDTSLYFDFVNRARENGITVPIVPGIMPIRNVGQIKRFTNMCGASIPENVLSDLSPIEADLKAVRNYGTEHAFNMCVELLEGGAPGLHLYTLNRNSQVEQILHRLSK